MICGQLICFTALAFSIMNCTNSVWLAFNVSFNVVFLILLIDQGLNSS